jgi:hypothetical protein
MKTLYKTKDRNFETTYYLDIQRTRTIVGKYKRARGKDTWWRYEVIFKPDEMLYYYEMFDGDYGRFSNGIPCRVSATLPQESIDEIAEKIRNGKVEVFDELERFICDRNP